MRLRFLKYVESCAYCHATLRWRWRFPLAPWHTVRAEPCRCHVVPHVRLARLRKRWRSKGWRYINAAHTSEPGYLKRKLDALRDGLGLAHPAPAEGSQPTQEPGEGSTG